MPRADLKKFDVRRCGPTAGVTVGRPAMGLIVVIDSTGVKAPGTDLGTTSADLGPTVLGALRFAFLT